MEGPHSTVPSVTMADALVIYIFNYQFKFKFNLNIIIANFNKIP